MLYCYLFFEQYIYIFIYLCMYLPPCRQARQGVFDPACWWSDCLGLVSCFKGPTPQSPRYSHPFFGLFFASNFLIVFWTQMVSSRDPKITQNREKSCSRSLPESTLHKVTKNDVIWKGQTSDFADCYTLSTVFPVAQGSQRRVKKPLKMEPRGTPNHKKNQKKDTPKIIEKQRSKKSHFYFKKEVGFRMENVSKITKIRDTFQMRPQVSQKVIQNFCPGSKYSKIIKK